MVPFIYFLDPAWLKSWAEENTILTHSFPINVFGPFYFSTTSTTLKVRQIFIMNTVHNTMLLTRALRFCQFDQNFGNSPSLYFWLWLGNDWLHVFLLIPPFLLLAASTNSSTLWKSLAPSKATMDNLKGFFLWTLTFKVRLVNGTLCYEMS